jgi:hypothetical protein
VKTSLRHPFGMAVGRGAFVMMDYESGFALQYGSQPETNGKAFALSPLGLTGMVEP